MFVMQVKIRNGLQIIKQRGLYMMSRILDWKRPILQTLVLIVIITLALRFDFSQVLAAIIKAAGISDDEIPLLIRVAVTYGRWPLSCLALLEVLHIIRKDNLEAVINPDNNTYHDYTYISYLFCSAILGYKQCRLKKVPIPMQIKLVTNAVFDNFIIDEGVHEAPENDKANTVISNAETYTNTVNFVISDTYKLTLDQLPEKVTDFTTIEIDRSSDDHTRCESKELVRAVIKTIRSLPQNVEEINVFATTNCTNTYRIAKEAFSTAGRDNIKHIYIYQQGRDNARNFECQGVKIY